MINVKKGPFDRKAFLIAMMVLSMAFMVLLKPEPMIAGESLNKEDCSFNGIKLYGKVQVVQNFPDIKVKIDNTWADIKVKMVDNFPDSCGEWQMVEHFPDFKVQFVDTFEDIKIKYVENWPGID